MQLRQPGKMRGFRLLPAAHAMVSLSAKMPLAPKLFLRFALAKVFSARLVAARLLIPLVVALRLLLTIQSFAGHVTALAVSTSISTTLLGLCIRTITAQAGHECCHLTTTLSRPEIFSLIPQTQTLFI